MGEDDFAVRESLKRIANQHTHGGTTSFMGIVEHWLGKGGMDEVGVDRMSWVDEDDRFSFVQLGPDGGELCVAEVCFAVTIASEEGDAVGGKMVEGVGNLGEGGLGVEQGGKRGEEAVGSGVFLLERRAIFVAVTR